MHRLANRIQPYAWGSPDAIPDLLGRCGDGTPQAELWIGAHPSAPSTVLDAGASPVGLDAFIAADPAGVLGPDRIGAELPFLLKVLSAASPLSLQVHPDAGRASRRFTEEESAGVPIDAPHRLYRDANHKPELLYALEPFAAMAGFRSPSAAGELLAGLQLTGLAPAAATLLADLLSDLGGSSAPVALQAATKRLLTADKGPLEALAAAVAAACEDRAELSAQCVVDLARHYPGDPGVLVSLLLNQVRLAAGQALYLPAGNVHAYLSGTGVELMASSDNVLRGGLTPKHVDVAELLEVVDFRVLPAPLLLPRTVSEHELLFAPEVADFALTVLRVGAETVWQRAVPRTLLCLDGRVQITSAASDLVLTRGDSAFARADEHPLTISGQGLLVAAAPGETSGA